MPPTHVLNGLMLVVWWQTHILFEGDYIWKNDVQKRSPTVFDLAAATPLN
jgi:hypothetical protein